MCGRGKERQGKVEGGSKGFSNEQAVNCPMCKVAQTRQKWIANMCTFRQVKSNTSAGDE